MTKRTAGSELNHDNWDDDDEEIEEAGTFKRASNEVIQKREKKVARRRNPGATSSSTSVDSGGAFKGFSFGAQASSSNDKLFSFGSSTSLPFSGGASSQKFSLFGSSATSVSESNINSHNNGKDEGKPGATSTNEQINGEYMANLRELNESMIRWITMHVDKNPYVILTPIWKDYEKYLAELEEDKKKNKSTDPLKSNENGGRPVGFGTSPVKVSGSLAGPGGFTFGASSASRVSTGLSLTPPRSEALSVTSSSPLSGFKFGSPVTSSGGFNPQVPTSLTPGLSSVVFQPSSSSVTSFSLASSGATSKPSFSVGFFSTSLASATSSSAAPTFSFNSSAAPAFSFNTTTTTSSGAGFSSITSSGGFTFGAASSGIKLGGFGQAPVSFGLPASGAGGAQGGEGEAGGAGDDEEYVPPQPEIQEIREEGAFYTIRCKLFYMKQGNWKEMGVGNLHLKKLEDTSKTQLLVRADNTSGIILLNVILTKNMPMRKMEKSNMSIVCVPNPALPDTSIDSSAPLQFLIRVKTAEDSEALFKQLQDNTPK